MEAALMNDAGCAADASEHMSQFIKKLLVLRGARNVICRVFPPSPGQRAYLIILERDRVREQFYLNPKFGAALGNVGLELAAQTEIRTALHNLDRLSRRKASR